MGDQGSGYSKHIWEFDREEKVKNRMEFKWEEKDHEIFFFFQETEAWPCLQAVEWNPLEKKRVDILELGLGFIIYQVFLMYLSKD